MSLDPHRLYELCVQSPRHVVSLLRAIHASDPFILREDFCGTAAVARRWIQEGIAREDDSRAHIVDLDQTALALAESSDTPASPPPPPTARSDRLTVSCEDAIAASDTFGADVIWVGNFSIGYIHTRPALIQYLKACKARLDRGNASWGGGIFACDLYGGATAFKLGSMTRKHPGRGHEMIHYHWEHEAADPITAMVENSISFKVEVAGEIIAHLPRAFVYRWRLWSLAELREALFEAGFTSIEIYTDINIPPGGSAIPITSPSQLGDDWIVVLAAR